MTTIKIKCINTGATYDVPQGASLKQFAQTSNIRLANEIIGASVNNKNVGLDFQLYKPMQVEFFDYTSPEGQRMYVRSLILLFHAAVAEVMPGTELNVLHSVSKGFYCELRRDGKAYDATTGETDALREKMRSLVEASLPIVTHNLPTDEAIALLDGMEASKTLQLQHGELYTTIHSIADHAAIFYGDLLENTRQLAVFDLKEFFSGILLQVPDTVNPAEVARMTLQNKMFATFLDFDKVQELLKIRHLSDLNSAIEKGAGKQIIQVAEALHEKKIVDIANMIAERRDTVKVILIAGPSSSGKTTFSKRLATQLILNGFAPVNISIDNYFVDRSRTPKDENGNYDFEAVEAIDVKLFNEQLLALIDGQEIKIPKFDFVKGEPYYDGQTLKLESNSVIVIEGTHGLTPQLTPMIPTENKFKIYVAPLAGINFDQLTRVPTTDNRLIRRIVRDYYNRGHNAEATIKQWPSVRRGEDKFIYTNQEEADVMFNSCLLYELATLKEKAEPILFEVKRNSPAYAEARRLLEFLSYVNPIESDSVPPTSLLREFVGGSSFVYD